MRRLVLGLSLALAGCGNPAPSTGNGDAAVDAADLAPAADLRMPDLAQPPLKPKLPQLDPHSGVALTAVQLVTITYNGWRYQQYVEGFGDYIVGSSWLTAVGSEYGVGPGTHVKKVHLDMPPMMINDEQIQQLLKGKIADGTLPAPSMTGPGSQYLYEIYFPQTTQVTNDLGASCSSFAGYHHFSTYNGAPFAYAVVDDCGAGRDDVTNTASHELIEAATDPFQDQPGVFLDTALPDPWGIEYGQEVGDMCEDQPSTFAGGFALARSWSNVAAAAGMDPCLPDPDPHYENVIALQSMPCTGPCDQAPTIPAGTDYTFTLIGWSASGSEPPWNIRLMDVSSESLIGQGLTFTLTQIQPRLSGQTIYDGAAVSVTITVPPTASSGDTGGFKVLSGPFNHSWPVAFTVQ